MASLELQEAIQRCDEYVKRYGIDEKIISDYTEIAELLHEENDIETLLKVTSDAKVLIIAFITSSFEMSMWELEKLAQSNNSVFGIVEKYYQILKYESFWEFESFTLYMERNRPWSKRFYQPRMKTLQAVVDDLQALEDRKYGFYGLSQPSRTGKSTICIFFLAWIAMKRPNSHNAMGGHSGVLAKGFYKELLNLIMTEEYTFKELFFYWHPEYANKPFPTEKSADEFTITLGDPDRFATITCRGIDGTWTGAIDVSQDGYLYVDDLVRDREHALSPNRMENTYQEYLNKMVDRKNDGARELMVGTLWNVLDPLERERKAHFDDPDYNFRKIPALNENDESNFDYEINGFSTEYYHKIREKLDPADWAAKYMQAPYVREGLIFPPDDLRYFNGVLPDGDHRIVAACDVALGGGDSLSMPVGAEYENGDVYIFAWIFNAGVKEITAPLVIGQIMGNKIRQIRFEANVGGDLYCEYIDEKLQEQGYKCSCEHRRAPNQMEKLSKIIAYSGDVKRKFIFLDHKKPTPEEREQDAKLEITRYVRDAEYQKAMDEFTSTVSIGKNEHEDAADGITQLEMYIENPIVTRKTKITKSPV